VSELRDLAQAVERTADLRVIEGKVVVSGGKVYLRTNADNMLWGPIIGGDALAVGSTAAAVMSHDGNLWAVQGGGSGAGGILPGGGLPGQALIKASAADGDATWQNQLPPYGSGGSTPGNDQLALWENPTQLYGDSRLGFDWTPGRLKSSKVAVDDDPYSASWDGSTDVPTKNAVYDKVQAVATKTFKTAQTIAVAGAITAAMFVVGTYQAVGASQTVTATSITLWLRAGTATIAPRRNGTAVGSNIAVTTTPTTTSLSQALSDFDYLDLNVIAASGAVDLSASIHLTHVVS
jgi:hypothetical protein